VAAQVIDGRAIARAVRDEVRDRIERAGVTPGFCDLLVGDDPASALYVGMKNRAAAKGGIRAFERTLPARASQADVLAVIDELNADERIHGVIVQLPLPPHVDTPTVQESIDPGKDVDGLHPENQGLIVLGRPRFIPATPLGVVELLKRSDVKVDGADVVVVGRSSLVGRPLSVLLSSKMEGGNATVTLCHTGTRSLADHTRHADVLVVAAGAPRSITADMVKPGAVVIDVGTNKLADGSLAGDVDFEGVREVAGMITPVPGGVGPMTVAMLLSNTATAAGA